MLLTEIAETSDAVASTRARLAKAERLAAYLRRLDPREVVVAAAFLSGELRQRQIGVGWASLRDVPPAAASQAAWISPSSASSVCRPPRW